MGDNSVYIAVLLDRSGSIESLRKGLVAGYNKFLEEQKAVNGTAYLKAAKFDHEYTVFFDGNLRDANPLTEADLVPRGETAALDAIGCLISDLGFMIGIMPETHRLTRVIVLIVTDGLDDVSVLYDTAEIREMIQNHDRRGWKFVLLDPTNKCGLIHGVGIRCVSPERPTSATMELEFKLASLRIAEYRSSCVAANQ